MKAWPMRGRLPSSTKKLEAARSRSAAPISAQASSSTDERQHRALGRRPSAASSLRARPAHRWSGCRRDRAPSRAESARPSWPRPSPCRAPLRRGDRSITQRRRRRGAGTPRRPGWCRRSACVPPAAGIAAGELAKREADHAGRGDRRAGGRRHRRSDGCCARRRTRRRTRAHARWLRATASAQAGKARPQPRIDQHRTAALRARSRQPRSRRRGRCAGAWRTASRATARASRRPCASAQHQRTRGRCRHRRVRACAQERVARDRPGLVECPARHAEVSGASPLPGQAIEVDVASGEDDADALAVAQVERAFEMRAPAAPRTTARSRSSRAPTRAHRRDDRAFAAGGDLRQMRAHRAERALGQPCCAVRRRCVVRLVHRPTWPLGKLRDASSAPAARRRTPRMRGSKPCARDRGARHEAAAADRREPRPRVRSPRAVSSAAVPCPAMTSTVVVGMHERGPVVRSTSATSASRAVRRRAEVDLRAVAVTYSTLTDGALSGIRRAPGCRGAARLRSAGADVAGRMRHHAAPRRVIGSENTALQAPRALNAPPSAKFSH